MIIFLFGQVGRGAVLLLAARGDEMQDLLASRAHV